MVRFHPCVHSHAHSPKPYTQTSWFDSRRVHSTGPTPPVRHFPSTEAQKASWLRHDVFTSACDRSRCWAPSRLISVDAMVRFHRLRPRFACPAEASQHAIWNSSSGRASDSYSESSGFKPRFQSLELASLGHASCFSRPARTALHAHRGFESRRADLTARSQVVRQLPIKEQSIVALRLGREIVSRLLAAGVRLPPPRLIGMQRRADGGAVALLSLDVAQ